MSNVTAIILNWNRPHNIPVIATHLQSIGLFNQILVWDNANANNLPENSSLYVSIPSQRNCYTLGRYLASFNAENDELYFQDDDILVGNIPQLYDYWKKQPTKIVAGLADQDGLKHWELEANKKPWLQLGWGSFHRKEWLELTDEYLVRYGEDLLLRRKWDRIYTALHGQHAPVKAKFKRLRNPSGQYSDSDSGSLWLMKDHMQLTHLAANRALAIRAEMQAQL